MLWEKAQNNIKNVISEGVFKLWIEPLQCMEVREDRILLKSPDKYFSAYVSQNFLQTIEEKLYEVDRCKRKVVFCEDQEKFQSISSNKVQLRLPTVPVNTSSMRSLHPRYTFEEYMVGDSNILAQSACRSISLNDDSVGPCLYINSSTGLGKSHLTQAVAHQVFSESPMTRLHYVTAQQFSGEMIRGIQNKTMDAFKKKYHEHCDVLLVEDVHALTGKKKTQEELNEILDILIKTGKRVILTANAAPRDLIGIDDEFRSRMTAGLVATIKPPDTATRLRIIEKKAAQMQLMLTPEYVEFLGQNISGDVRRLESAIVAIRAKAKLRGGTVSFDLIREAVLNVVGSTESLSLAMIADLVSRQFNVKIEDMKSRSREKRLAFPRQVAMYLCRKYTDKTLGVIGKQFNRDHSTVLHSIKAVTDLMVRDTSIGAQVDFLGNKLKNL